MRDSSGMISSDMSIVAPLISSSPSTFHAATLPCFQIPYFCYRCSNSFQYIFSFSSNRSSFGYIPALYTAYIIALSDICVFVNDVVYSPELRVVLDTSSTSLHTMWFLLSAIAVHNCATSSPQIISNNYLSMLHNGPRYDESKLPLSQHIT